MNRIVIASATVILMLNAGAALSANDPLSGTWALNRPKSYYGNGAEPRRHETMECITQQRVLACTIRSVRADGRVLTGVFRAEYDGKAYPSFGIPDVDHVKLTKVNESIADATFLFKGRPVFGYRAVRSADGRNLTIVSVDPDTRRVLTSVIVYERQ